nr:HAD-IIIC family phosphatase [uncultured Massilia sp.]
MKLQIVSNTVGQVFGKLPEILQETGDWTLQYGDLGQVGQFLLHGCDADMAVLLLDTDYFVDVYADAGARARLDELAGQIRTFRASNATRLLVSNLVLPQHALHFHQADTDAARIAVMEINAAIAHLAADVPDVAVLDLCGVALEMGSSQFYRTKNKFVFQSPYSPAAVARIAQLVLERVRQYQQPRKKVCVLDADNTLWGGVLGEEGPDGIKIDRNYPGIVHAIFQRQLRQLKDSGVLLALVTKNNADDIAELFERRRMPLALSDFASVKANWDRKSVSIAQISDDLNLGLSSFVFIDDSPFEIEEVRSTLPEVQCVQFDANSFLTGAGVLAAIPGLQALRITAEDRDKSAQYRAEQSRQAARTGFQSLEDYIASLDILVTCAVNDDKHLDRIAQLVNKTNQFNLTCERLSESDVQEFMRRGTVFDFHVRDKFGDMGIVGVLILVEGEIVNFLLSCRVLGRRVEDKILAMVARHPAAAHGLRARYRPGSKNMQVATLYDRLGFVPGSARADGGKDYRLERAVDDPAYISFAYADTKESST